MSSFPTEIWDWIFQFCPSGSIRSLMLVSHRISRIARPHLLRTITYIDENEHPKPKDVEWTYEVQVPGLNHYFCADPGFIVRRTNCLSPSNDTTDMDKVQILVKPECRQHLRKAFLVWRSDGIPTTIESSVNLISEFPKLEFIHLSLPTTMVSLSSLNTSKVRSITASVPARNIIDYPDFEGLLSIFQIPTLRTLCLDSMLRLDCDVPSRLRQPGCSNVKDLKFVGCGYPTGKLHPLLLWPKHLDRIEMQPCSHLPDSMRPAYGWGGVDSVFLGLEPLKRTIQEVKYLDEAEYEYTNDGDCFKQYDSLKKLEVTLEILMTYICDDEARGLVDEYPYDKATLPIEQRLPSSLEEVKFELSEFPWENLVSPDRVSHREKPEAEELFEWLLGLIPHRDRFPHLHRVTLDHGHWGINNCSPPRPSCPLYHDRTREVQSEFAQAGIEFVIELNPDLI